MTVVIECNVIIGIEIRDTRDKMTLIISTATELYTYSLSALFLIKTK
jgi:hypothetical protein